MKRNASKRDFGIAIAIGIAAAAPVSQASSIYRMVISAGMGKERRDVPEGRAVTITFKDGSSLELRETAFTEKTAIRETGLFIKFTGPEGFTYKYDTDKLTFDSILAALPGK